MTSTEASVIKNKRKKERKRIRGWEGSWIMSDWLVKINLSEEAISEQRPEINEWVSLAGAPGGPSVKCKGTEERTGLGSDLGSLRKREAWILRGEWILFEGGGRELMWSWCQTIQKLKNFTLSMGYRWTVVSRKKNDKLKFVESHSIFGELTEGGGGGQEWRQEYHLGSHCNNLGKEYGSVD